MLGINYLVTLLFTLAALKKIGGAAPGKTVSVPQFPPEEIGITKEIGGPSTEYTYEDFIHRPGSWDDRDLDSLAVANKKWAERTWSEAPDYFKANELGHAPKILWIGCSDARVPASELFGEVPGSIFVHRNIANMVVHTDCSCMSVLQYAVDVLKVKHIVVCGHYDCGGVKAAMDNLQVPSPLEDWLKNIKDTFRLHKGEILAIPDKIGRQHRLVELNAIEQAINIYKIAHIQKARNNSRKKEKEIMRYMQSASKPGRLPFTEPQVHAYAFDPMTGLLKKLNMMEHIQNHLSELSKVYNVY
mmetsp:Transcript_9886/g.9991  ORF Transcript_9886/g.9991 Transcript_9886/m.9991 type:complete len:301 (+) Transcript_9886:25-927(+)|eukprot:CAMPEP_0182426492 /NCGR_PEP_ID=MMETSP1167-20130531/12990_1 /TAXON_ID=2988 /ORGANISM="Mallomonas Sp, Strain CCMP3275" /LENGTH=300 /DNA_ID=CAMNT_0024607961 /DNA_START=25 /DNA_END=927 /DNA_ORIENTATION=-